MGDFNSETFRKDMIGIWKNIRNLCAARVPANLGHYTGSQLRMITRIHELTRDNNEGIQLKTLAGVLQITPAATSEMVETLVKRGALERRVAANDRRAMSLRLTKDLEDIFQNAEQHLDSLLENFFEQMPPEQQKSAGEIIRQLNKYLTDSNQPEE